MASFNSHSFKELLDGGSSFSAPEGDTTINYTVYHIPGGGTNVMVNLGANEQNFELPFSCTASQLSALQGDVGSSHTLVWHKGSTTAVLVGVNQVKKHTILDYYRGTLKFVSGV